ncbi:uncharacterized protein LOC127093120 isoform X1 [Lathyrus oleraceus]|uniref:Uncharacterized protein n=1 Tax=Pisum sativum TaxID=3888 RepID=A0A9D4WBN6_PEA|nr:uncharacterized protein LOC127093120 isoform X1 [Pisum sativum]KAI5398772.1 hypothetical protein KIW84_064232 [Pisum sativum]
MATETLELASDPTHQEFVKQEKDEAIAEKINSLAKEEGDKPDDAQDQSTPSSTTEGDVVKAELEAAEIEKGDDSSALKEFVKHEKDEAIAEKIDSLANEDGGKPDDAQRQATTSATAEGDEVKAELVAAEIVKDDDSSELKEFVKQEKDEAIAEKIDSLANEDGGKPDDAQGQPTPSSTTEGDEVKAELASEAIVKGDDSSVLKEFVKPEKDEAIAEKINSLANEDEDKPADAQGQATPSSTTEGDEVKAELAAAEIVKDDNSSKQFVKLEKDEAIEEKINSLANEDGDKPDDAQGQATPTSEAGDEVKAELTAAEIEKGDDSSALKEFVNPEKDEAISEKINSLANEDVDKPKDAQGQATPSTTEGDKVKAELASEPIEKGGDSSALKELVKLEKDEAIAEKIDSLANENEDEPDDTQGQATPSSTTEGDEVKAELASEAIEKGDDSSALKEFVKLEKDEAIAEKINSLANEDGDKSDDAQDQATPSSTTEGDEVKAELAEEIEKGDDSSVLTVSAEDSLKPDVVDDAQNSAAEKGDDEKAELAAVEIEKSDDSSAVKISIEDSLKPDIVDDTLNSAVEKVDEEKAELPVAVEKFDDSAPLEPVAVADNVEEEKDLIPESQPISFAEPMLDAAISQQDEPPSTEPDVKETQQPIEKEPVETDRENQSKTEDVPEAEIIEKSVDATEYSSDATETNQSAVDEVKRAGVSETSAEKVAEPVATEERDVSQEPEKESQENSEEAEQPSTIAIVEPSTEANEEKSSTNIAEETNNNNDEIEPTEKAKSESVVTEVEPTETKSELVVAEIEPAETVKDESVVTEVEENQTEPEQKSTKTREEKQPNTSSLPEQSAETNDVAAVEEKTRELEFEAPRLKDTNNDDAGPTETEKAEPVVTQVEPTKSVKEELVVAEVEPTETVKEEPAITEIGENQKEPESQSTEPREEEQPNTSSIPEQSTETNNVIVVEGKTRELEFEAAILKEINNNDAGPTETEKAEPVVTEADENQGEQEIQSSRQEEEEKPKDASESREQIGDAVEVHPLKDLDIEAPQDTGNLESEAIPAKEENIGLLSNGVEEKPREQLQIGEEVVETIKEVEPEQATEKSGESLEGTIRNSSVKEEESETNTKVNTEQVSLKDSANPVEPSPEVKEKIVVEDVKKEVVGVTENATGVKEKVDVATEDVKKEPEAPDAVQVSSRETEVEIKKAEEQNEAKTTTPEAREADTKVDEISRAVSEPVRETLASKFEEKDKEEKTIQTGENNSEKEQIKEPVKTEVEATKENDTTTVSKDLPKETPSKPAQKQSSNIISKVKQSLVKAKKAITGKSPSSKNLNSDQKGDIKVK